MQLHILRQIRATFSQGQYKFCQNLLATVDQYEQSLKKVTVSWNLKQLLFT